MYWSSEMIYLWGTWSVSDNNSVFFQLSRDANFCVCRPHLKTTFSNCISTWNVICCDSSFYVEYVTVIQHFNFKFHVSASAWLFLQLFLLLFRTAKTYHRYRQFICLPDDEVSSGPQHLSVAGGSCVDKQLPSKVFLQQSFDFGKLWRKEIAIISARFAQIRWEALSSA